MNQGNKKRLIVVLGMHRSGTSALTRGLSALGIELGDKLMPAFKGNNEKGFWEDVDINLLNNELLQFLGSSWDDPVSIQCAELGKGDLACLRIRAVGLLRDKLQDTMLFGIKDPRIARLLPFWKTVFHDLNLDVAYVIVVRNPLSVSNSLFKRDGFALEKSAYLWLGHMIPSILGSKDAPRIVVDYDILMARPQEQLTRIANAFKLPFNAFSPEVEEYTKGFLTTDLRHELFGIGDLNTNSSLPQEIIKAYILLNKLATDELLIDSTSVQAAFEELNQHMAEMRPAFIYIKQLESQLVERYRTANDRDTKIKDLARTLNEYEEQLASKNIEINNFVRQLNERQRTLDAMLSSASWKITAPFRRAFDLIRFRN